MSLGDIGDISYNRLTGVIEMKTITGMVPLGYLSTRSDEEIQANLEGLLQKINECRKVADKNKLDIEDINRFLEETDFVTDEEIDSKYGLANKTYVTQSVSDLRNELSQEIDKKLSLDEFDEFKETAVTFTKVEGVNTLQLKPKEAIVGLSEDDIGFNLLSYAISGKVTVGSKTAPLNLDTQSTVTINNEKTVATVEDTQEKLDKKLNTEELLQELEKVVNMKLLPAVAAVPADLNRNFTESEICGWFHVENKEELISLLTSETIVYLNQNGNKSLVQNYKNDSNVISLVLTTKDADGLDVTQKLVIDFNNTSTANVTFNTLTLDFVDVNE